MKLSLLRLLGLLVLIASLPCLGDQSSTIVEGEGFRLKLLPGTEISAKNSSANLTVLTAALDKQKARIRSHSEETTILFPDNAIRIREKLTNHGYQITVDFAGRRYIVEKSRREIHWKLPGEEVFFTTRGGAVTQALSDKNFLKIRRDTPSGRATLQSNSGTSDVLLHNNTLEVFDGPAIEQHAYFVRGLAFKQGPVLIEIPLPGGVFIDALPRQRYLSFENNPVAADTSVVDPYADYVEPKPADPLRAEPADWHSPVIKSNSGEKNSDPLNAKREKRIKHETDPLKAKTTKDSDEILRVKDY